MDWRIEFTRNADKAMRKLDKGVAARVFDELDEIAKLEDPRSRGKALTGNLAGVWRYRVGDYRILCDINDGRLVILVVDVAHRREVLAAIERDKAGKAVRAANKSVGDAMKSASSEIDALANEARAMMDARSELEDKAGEPDHTAAKSFHGRD